MFVKITPRKKANKTYYYAELVEGYRENGKVKHKRIAYIGAVDLETAKKLKLVFSSKTKPIDLLSLIINTSVDYGNFQYLYSLFNKLGMTKYFTKHFKPVDSHVTVETALKYIQLMIINRIIEPSSKLALIEWLEHTPYKHFFDVNVELQTMYRSLEVLEKNLNHVEEFLYKTSIKKFNQNRDELFYDITSSYMEGHKCIIADYGYSRDHRGDKEQIVIGLITTYDGFPIKCNIYKGNTVDKVTVPSVVQEIKEQFSIDKFVFVGDRGMITADNISKIKKEQQEFVMAIPREWTKKYLKNINIDKTDMEKIKENELYARFINYEDEDNMENVDRFLLCLNIKKKADDEAYREKVMSKLIEEINELNEKVGNIKCRINTKDELVSKVAIIKKKKYGKYFNIEYIEDNKMKCGYKIKYIINKEKLAEDKKLDGTFLIQTNAKKYTDKELIHIYKNLNEVEKAFKAIKNVLDIRPMFHRKEERVKGHVYICFLAYYLYNAIDYWLKENNINLSPDKLLHKLRKISLVEFQLTEKQEAYQLTKIDAKDEKIFEQMDIKIKLPK